MAFCPLQMVALVLGTIGMIGTFIVTLMPQWKVSAFTGTNIIVFETIWEGLWMTCVSQISNYQCEFYTSVLALPPNLDAARGLMCTACALSVIACLTASAGTKCIQWPRNNEQIKRKKLLFSGGIFLLAGLMVLIPVSLIADNIIKDFYNPLIHDARKRELGAALYLGWITSALLICGGAIFCSFSRCSETSGGCEQSTPSSCNLRNLEQIKMKPLTMRSYV